MDTHHKSCVPIHTRVSTNIQIHMNTFYMWKNGDKFFYGPRFKNNITIYKIQHSVVL